MKSALRSWFVMAPLLLLVNAPRASADLTLTAKSAMPQGYRYDVGYDRYKDVYLLTWDSPPVSGQFADANGIPFGPRFQIATEAVGQNPYTSWSTVTAGGTANDPVFLVTYLAVEGKITNKYARLIRYVNGAPVIGARVFLANVSNTWFAANNARSAWDGDRFVVSTHVIPPGAGLPRPQVQHVDLAGNTDAAVLLGDAFDYEAAPSLACSPDHVCMLAGFAQGIPFGSKGGVYAQLFNGQSLQPITGLFYLDDHSAFMDSPQVVFNSRTNKFSSLWYRRTNSVVDFRLVGTDGQMGPLDLTKSFGTGAGDLGYAFNDTTGTGLLVTKVGGSADLYGLEIGDAGYYTGANVLLHLYNNSGWPTYSTSVAANPDTGGWLVAYMTNVSGVAATVKGTPSGPASNAQLAIDAPAAGGVPSTFNVKGWAADFGSTSGSGADWVDAWAWPAGGGAPIYLGGGTPSLSRPDVGAIFGGQFTNSGYNVGGTALAPGSYVVAVYMHSTVTGTFNAVRTVNVTVGAPLGPNGPNGGNDFDGDVRSEITVYNPSSGVWSSLRSAAGYSTASNIGWGGATYTPVPGDYDGDGRADLGVYEQASGNWYVLLSGSSFTTALSKNVGGPGWVPVAGDYDGDGKTDFVVYNTTTGLWYGLKSGSGYTTTLSIGYGGTGYTAAPGDFDGDHKMDICVYNGATGNWFLLLSTSGYSAGLSASVGGAGYVPAQADYDGDGRADFVVYNTTTGLWYGLKSTTGYTTTLSVGWGGAGFTPVKGDYDGDGKSDLAVYQASTGMWYILLSGAGYSTAMSKNWGGPGYMAVPGYQ